jgi:hypothetical protein
MCGRSFREWRYRQRQGARFCSRLCDFGARRVFRQALADGRLDALLAEERARIKAELATPKSHRYKNAYWPKWLEEKK